MDRAQFLEMIRDPKKSREELKRIQGNAQRSGRLEEAELVRIVLDRRFSGWSRTVSPNGRKTPTRASFRNEQQEFETAKDAYTWLLNKFLFDRPDVLASEEWQREFVADGRSAKYFARRPEMLFPDSPHLATDPTKYERVGEGWYANMVLSNDQKFQVLGKFAATAGYRYGSDWSWAVLGKPEVNPEVDLKALLNL